MSEHPEGTLWPIAKALAETDGGGAEMSPALRTFSNALRVMHSLDLHEIEATGFRGDWPAFRDDPVRFFMRSGDADQSAIWDAIEKRQPESLKSRESA